MCSVGHECSRQTLKFLRRPGVYYDSVEAGVGSTILEENAFRDVLTLRAAGSKSSGGSESSGLYRSIASAMLDEGNPVRILVHGVKSAMGNCSNASAVKAGMGNGSIASTMLDEPAPPRYLRRQ